MLFSCSPGTGNEKTYYSDFEVEIDTILVDSEDEILMAGSDIYTSGVTIDNKKLYSLDQKNFALEIIDTENYRLENKVYFKKEGPESLGTDYFYDLFPLPNERFGFTFYETYRIHDLKGNLIKEVKLDENWINGNLEGTERIELSSVDVHGNVLAGMHFDFDSFKPIMFLLDSEKEKVESIELPEFDKIKRYKITLRRNGGYLTHADPNVFIKFQEDSILISNSAFNDIYIYKWVTKELKHMTYNHQLVPSGKQKTYQNDSESEEEIIQIIYDISEEVDFTEFFRDELNDKYYRFAHEANYLEDKENPTYKVFMMVYDKKLKLIGEKELMTFESEVTPLFVKDGKVHFHLNMEDELGFIRIGLKN